MPAPTLENAGQGPISPYLRRRPRSYREALRDRRRKRRDHGLAETDDRSTDSEPGDRPADTTGDDTPEGTD